MILADTSVWVEFQRATGSREHVRLRTALEAGEALATTGAVVLELLAGARDERQAREFQRLLARCRFLPLEEPADHEVAAALYRACRRHGETVRKLPDCLIATVAIRTGSELLHRNGNFEAIARHAPLALVQT